MNKKLVCTLMAGTMLATGLVGCGGAPAVSGSGASGAQEGSELSGELVFAIWDNNLMEYIDQNDMVGKFQEKYPNAEIEVEKIKDDTEYWNAMKMRASANQLPDIMFNKPFTLSRFQDYLLDLSDTEACANNTLAEGYALNGKVLGIPMTAGYEYVYYWKDMFEEAGVEVPTTWEELKTVSMFLASLLTGSLASKLKSHAKRSAQVAWRTKLLLETNQNLQKARTEQEIVSVTAKQLLKIFQRDIIAYRIKEEKPVMPQIFLVDSAASPERYTSEKEREVAQWVITNNKRAGAGTENFSDSCCTYLSVRTGKQIYGVVGIAASEKPLDSFETSILLSVLGESALALENQKNLEEKEAAAVLAKNEQLRANLLRSISHDLRTPLTSISGNASNLLSNGDLFDAKTKKQMYTDIYDDSMWLINLVENLLSVSRLEEGRMNLHVSTELIDEVVAEALRHINRKSAEYRLHVQNSEEYLLAQIDAKLIVQVIINIVDNAIKYTPAGSEIDIGWKRKGNYIYISIADNGPGISDQAKPHIFDMFYSASNQIADSRRSMGLGLALCKSIVNAHGGEITVTDHLPHGSIFTFSVPAGGVELHE